MSRAPAICAVALLAVASCRAERAPQHVEDATGALRPIVAVTPVNNGTYGMIARVRWTFPEDRSGILVVVDAVGVEAEPVPDGFFFGLEQPTFAVQVDTVWDVAPSPDWRSVAFSRAYVLGHGESEVIPPEQWEAVARATGLDTATLRAASFNATAMAYARAIAHPMVIDVPDDPRAPDAAQTARARPFAIARGWRIRWTADGSMIALGSNPQMIQDDAPSLGWTLLNSRTGAVSAGMPAGTQIREVQWVHGPDLDTGAPINVTDAPPITVRANGLNYMIESVRGVVSIRDPAFQTHVPVPIGPGVALAASASGRYIVALRPRPPEHEGGIPYEVVVYTMTL